MGFTPTNEAWNASTAELGLFLFQSGDKDANRYRAAFLNGCRRYNDEFVDSFIEHDRTWKVSRIMAYVAAGGGMLATVSTTDATRYQNSANDRQKLSQLCFPFTRTFTDCGVAFGLDAFASVLPLDRGHDAFFDGGFRIGRIEVFVF